MGIYTLYIEHLIKLPPTIKKECLKRYQRGRSLHFLKKNKKIKFKTSYKCNPLVLNVGLKITYHGTEYTHEFILTDYPKIHICYINEYYFFSVRKKTARLSYAVVFWYFNRIFQMFLTNLHNL